VPRTLDVMCGRFALDEKADDVASFLAAVNEFPERAPAYSIAPTNVIPLVREWPQFNSRIETLDTLGLWKEAAASTRWGIYTPRKDDVGEWYVTASIVTREGRDASGELHDRMAAFLTDDLVGDWLNPTSLDAEQPQGLIGDLAATWEKVAATITTSPADRKVNKARTAHPAYASLIESA
jgi:putative SOS response-associated peptidase YedK